jgi:(S)-mandelate dehydrogenase
MWPNSRRYYTGPSLSRTATIEDLRMAMRRRLPSFVAEYLEGGAENEVTLARNRAVFDEARFAPRMLTDISHIDTSTTLFGQKIPFPVVVAPTGLNGLITHLGDLQLAAAASNAGIPFSQSMVSMALIESVAPTLQSPHWMQLYLLRDRQFTLQLLERATAARCQALIVTVDGSLFGNREWDRRNYIEPTILDWRNRMDVLAHPRWLLDIWRDGRGPRFVNVEHYTGNKMAHADTARWLHREMDASLNWNDIAWLRSIWSGKLILKGLMTVDDIARAIDIGADAVVLSNHGGRQLDLVDSPMRVLPAVAAFAKGRIAILLDSGIRRGSDIVQALALGADAVLVGRAVLYGLAASRQAGAERALAILKEEMVRTMGLLGRVSVPELDTSLFVSRD